MMKTTNMQIYTAPFTVKQRRGLTEDLKKQDYNLVVETAIECLCGGLCLDLSEHHGYAEHLFMRLPAIKKKTVNSMRERLGLGVCIMGIWWLRSFFSYCSKVGRHLDFSIDLRLLVRREREIKKNIAVQYGAVPCAGMYVCTSKFIVTRQP